MSHSAKETRHQKRAGGESWTKFENFWEGGGGKEPSANYAITTI